MSDLALKTGYWKGEVGSHNRRHLSGSISQMILIKVEFLRWIYFTYSLLIFVQSKIAMPHMYELRSFSRSAFFCDFSHRRMVFSPGISEQPILINFRRKLVFLYCLSPEDGVARLSRNSVRKYYSALHKIVKERRCYLNPGLKPESREILFM